MLALEEKALKVVGFGSNEKPLTNTEKHWLYQSPDQTVLKGIYETGQDM